MSVGVDLDALMVSDRAQGATLIVLDDFIVKAQPLLERALGL